MSDLGRNTVTDQSELLSVVVPAHNEAAGIMHAIDVIATTLASCGMRLEIIVVDDGSRDATFERIKERSIADDRVRGLRFTRNFGKEAALLAGLRVASGEAVVTIDSDLQHPPALIPKMIEEWRKGAMVVDAVKRRRENDGESHRGRLRRQPKRVVRVAPRPTHGASGRLAGAGGARGFHRGRLRHQSGSCS